MGSQNLSNRELENIVRTELKWSNERIARSRKIDLRRAVVQYHSKRSDRLSSTSGVPGGTEEEHGKDRTGPTQQSSSKKETLREPNQTSRDTLPEPVRTPASLPSHKPLQTVVPAQTLAKPGSDMAETLPSSRSPSSGSSLDPAPTPQTSCREDLFTKLRTVQREHTNLRALLGRTQNDVDTLRNQSSDQDFMRPLSNFERMVAGRIDAVAQEISTLCKQLQSRADEITGVTRALEARLNEFQQVSPMSEGVADSQRSLDELQQSIREIKNYVEGAMQ